jgi:hypothetical protein
MNVLEGFVIAKCLTIIFYLRAALVTINQPESSSFLLFKGTEY